MKKVLKVLGIIIAILIVLVAIYYVVIHFDGFLNKDNPMTREEVVELLEKGKEYPNYYYASENSWIFGSLNETKTEIYIKDNVEKIMVDGKLHRWIDYNNDENISIFEDNEGKEYAGISNLDNFEENEESQRGFDYSLISNEEVFNTDFKYLGEKQVDGRDTIIVKVWNKDWVEVDSTKFYIDKETGLITRRIDYSALGFIKIDCNRNVKMDIVTDEDIERPNLDGYEILQ